MVTISHERTWAPGDAPGLGQVTDMEVIDLGGSTYLYTVDATDGTMVCYDITGGQVARREDVHKVGEHAASPAQDIELLIDGGEVTLIAAGPTSGQVRAFSVDPATGDIVSEAEAFPVGGDPGSVTAMTSYQRGGASYVATVGTDDMISGFGASGAGLAPVPRRTVDEVEVEDASAVEYVRGPFGRYVCAASPDEITVTRAVKDGKLKSHDTIGAGDGLHVSAISDLATVDTLGLDYLLVADRGTGSVHSVWIEADGGLSVVDALYDDRETRFGAASTIESFSVKSRDFAAVAGGDGGFTVIEVLCNGILREVATFVDDGAASLTGVAAIEVSVTGTVAALFVSSTVDGGMSQFEIDFGTLGVQRTAPAAGGPVSGSGKDDLIVGGDFDDELYGKAGDDVIWDGAGEDHISGAAGADVFMMAYDGEYDLVVGFEAGTDKIDLSDWPLVHDTSRLDIRPYDAGARIFYYDELIRITSQDRTPITTLSEDDFIFG